MNEQWRDVNGYEGLYQVSNFGNVRSLDREQNHPRYKDCKRVFHGRLLKTTSDKDEYCLVSLFKNGKRESGKVHRLVAQAFIPNQDSKPQVNHIDGNKRNNCVDNLEWVSGSENMQHSFNNGLRPTRKICDQYGNVYNSTCEAARLLGLYQGNIWKVLNGDCTHTGGYVFRDL